MITQENIARGIMYMWNKAADIKKQLDAGTYEPVIREWFIPQVAPDFERFATMQPTMPVRASDCSPKSAGLLMSPSSVANGFESGATLIQQLINGFNAETREPFRCPKCKFESKSPVGNRCPKERGGCGLTKEEFAQEARRKGMAVC